MRVRLSTVCAGIAFRAPQRRPTRRLVQMPAKLGWIDKCFGEKQAVAKGRPVPACALIRTSKAHGHIAEMKSVRGAREYVCPDVHDICITVCATESQQNLRSPVKESKSGNNA